MDEVVESLTAKLSLDYSKFQHGMEKAELAVEAFKEVLHLAGEGLHEVGHFLAESVVLAGKHQDAMVALASALSRAGVKGAGQAAEGFAEFAQQMQRTTKFSEDAIISGAQLAASFGITGDKLKRATQAAMGMSTVMGTDLHRSMMMLARAQGGSIQMFSRFGIHIDKATFQAKGLDAVIDALNQKFGGAAQKAAETYNGRLEIMKNAWEDVQKAIGGAVVHSSIVNAIISTSTQKIYLLTEYINKNRSTMNDWIFKGWTVVGRVVTMVIQTIGVLGQVFSALKTVGNAVMYIFVKGWQLQLELLSAMLWPLKKVFDAAVAVGAIKVNPLAEGFAAVDEVLQNAADSFAESTKESADATAQWEKWRKTSVGAWTDFQGEVVAAASKMKDFEDAAGPAAKAAEKAVDPSVIAGWHKLQSEVSKSGLEIKKAMGPAGDSFATIQTNGQAARIQIQAVQEQMVALTAVMPAGSAALKEVSEKVSLLKDKEFELMQTMKLATDAAKARYTEQLQAAQELGRGVGEAFAIIATEHGKAAAAQKAAAKAVLTVVLSSVRKMIEAYAAEAAAKQAAANAGIPGVGVFVMAAAASAAFALVEGYLAKFAGGGEVGYGTAGNSRRDSVKALLTPGEYVVPSAQVQRMKHGESLSFGGRSNSAGKRTTTGPAPTAEHNHYHTHNWSFMIPPNASEFRRIIRDVFMPAMNQVTALG